MRMRGGFTLVEMAITATIMIMASSMLIVFSQGSGNRLTLGTEAAKISGVLNRAKSLALQRYRTEGGSSCGFAFRWNDPAATYTISPVLRDEERNCTDVQPAIETFALNRNVMFQGPGDTIIFESPYLTTRNPLVIQIALRDNPEENTAGIEVTAGGAIVMR